MIDKTALEQVINEALEGSKMFLVTLKVSKDNIIDVALDSDEDITIDDCVAVNDAVLNAFDRDDEDYELTVGSGRDCRCRRRGLHADDDREKETRGQEAPRDGRGTGAV